jgi:hypothetical protein
MCHVNCTTDEGHSRRHTILVLYFGRGIDIHVCDPRLQRRSGDTDYDPVISTVSGTSQRHIHQSRVW